MTPKIPSKVLWLSSLILIWSVTINPLSIRIITTGNCQHAGFQHYVFTSLKYYYLHILFCKSRYFIIKIHHPIAVTLCYSELLGTSFINFCSTCTFSSGIWNTIAFRNPKSLVTLCRTIKPELCILDTVLLQSPEKSSSKN